MDDREALLRAEYAALKREAERLYREAQACELRMSPLLEPLRELITERVWREHTRLRRDRPASQRTASRLVEEEIHSIKYGPHGHDAYLSARADDREIVEGSVASVRAIDLADGD